MKNIKYTLAAVAMCAALATPLQAQDASSGAVINKGKEKVTQEVDKVKEAAKDREAKIRKQKEKVTNQTGGIKDPKPTLTSGTTKVGQTASDVESKRKAIMADYEKAIANASTEAEKEQLRKGAKARIAALSADGKGKVKEVVDTKLDEVSETTSKGKDEVENTTDRVKTETEKVTREVNTTKESSTGVITKKARIVKMDEVKTKIANKQSNLAAKQALVKNGKARIAKATAKLDADIAAGKLNDDQIKEKRASIARVQATVDRLEASLGKGKEVYDAKEAVLMDMSKN